MSGNKEVTCDVQPASHEVAVCVVSRIDELKLVDSSAVI